MALDVKSIFKHVTKVSFDEYFLLVFVFPE